MDNRVVIDNVIDTTISRNTGNKLPDNITFNNSHTTWNKSANKVPFSNKCLCATSYINYMQTEALMSNDNEHEQVTLHMLTYSVSSFFPLDYHQQTEEE
jgi:hypothetical protein